MSCLSRPFEAEMLELPELDAETQRALFPNLPTADAASRSSRWKWSDIGAAPALHRFVQHAQHPTAAAAGTSPDQEGCETAPGVAANTAKQQADSEHHKSVERKALTQIRSAPTSRRASPTGLHSRSPSCSPHPEHYLVSLRWGAPGSPPLHPQAPTRPACLSSGRSQSPPGFSTSHHHARANLNFEDPTAKKGLSQEPQRSHLPHSSSPTEGLLADALMEAWFRSASPSVARACVTLPGFCPPAKAQHLPQGAATEEEHKPAANVSAGEHAFHVAYDTSYTPPPLPPCLSTYCYSAQLSSLLKASYNPAPSPPPSQSAFQAPAFIVQRA